MICFRLPLCNIGGLDLGWGSSWGSHDCGCPWYRPGFPSMGFIDCVHYYYYLAHHSYYLDTFSNYCKYISYKRCYGKKIRSELKTKICNKHKACFFLFCFLLYFSIVDFKLYCKAKLKSKKKCYY